MSNSTNDVTNILIVGTGGQGVVLASEILAHTALESGLDVKKSEIHGMSQRGGVVSSHVRFGKKVASSIIQEGRANILLSFELAETLRWLSYLAPHGKVAASNQKIVPPIVSTSAVNYPRHPAAILNKATETAIIVDARQMASALGNEKLVNTIMLGIISNYLKLPENCWETVIQKAVPAKFKDLNMKAFNKGKSLATPTAAHSTASREV